MKTYLAGLLVVGLVASGLGWYVKVTGRAGVLLRTAPVERGDLSAVVNASGTVYPEEVVDVGAQVAGQIKKLGVDAQGKRIDYRSRVAEGMELARLDDTLYAAQVEEAAAQVEQAQSNVHRAELDLIQMQAKLHQAERDWRRAQTLGPGNGNAISNLDFDTCQAVYETSKAAVGAAEAVVRQAKKSVAQFQAALNRAQANLGYTVIKSPVDGEIIDRRVNIGQTVVASLNSPSLFLIAKDLKRMQVLAAINEADIGQIFDKQKVRFNVDAYPDEVFQGEVSQVRLNASMTQNVVTYTVVVNTDNSSLRLLPYQTATLQFESRSKTNVLKVPNTALRWRPQRDLILPSVRAAYLQAQRRKEGPATAAERERLNQGTVWVEEDGFVRPIAVRVGLSDGQATEVSAADLAEDMEVVVGEARPESEEKKTNPLLPQIFGARKKENAQ